MTRNELLLSRVLIEAMEQGREVRLTPADRNGVDVEIDGRSISETHSGEGLPWESFSYPVVPYRGTSSFTQESQEWAHEIMMASDSDRCPECYRTRTRFTTEERPDTELIHCPGCEHVKPARGEVSP